MRLIYKRTVTGFLVVILALGGLLSTTRPAQAATITVDTIDDQYDGGETDAGLCSLREAITAANTDRMFGGCTAGSGTDLIYLPALSGTYYQISRKNPPGVPYENNNVYGDLDITSSMTIVGGGGIDPASGTARATVRRNTSTTLNDRIFHIIQPGGAQITVNFTSLGIRDGENPSDGKGGGGVSNVGAKVNLYRVLIRGNNASLGAGLSNSRAGTMTVKESNIIDNTGNTGGGIYSEGMLTVEASLIRNNSATVSGGGIDARGLGSIKTVIRNTTITSNQSDQGAGIANSGPLELYHATIIRNTGLGIHMGNLSSLTMANTILADNYISENTQAECMVQAEGATAVFTSLGGNLVEDDPFTGGLLPAVEDDLCIFNHATDLLTYVDNTQFRIAPSLTYTKYTGAYEFESNDSPAVDYITNLQYCPRTDQFYHPRPWNGICDIGAVEQGSGFDYRSFFPSVRR